jgi:hypothetical protein
VCVCVYLRRCVCSARTNRGPKQNPLLCKGGESETCAVGDTRGGDFPHGACPAVADASVLAEWPVKQAGRKPGQFVVHLCLGTFQRGHRSITICAAAGYENRVEVQRMEL